MEEKRRTPNDQRSDVHNSTSPEYKAAMDHHSQQSNSGSAANKASMDNYSRQMNPRDSAYGKSRGKK